MPCRQLFLRLWDRIRSQITAGRELLAGDFSYTKNYFFGMDYLMVVAGVRLDSSNAVLRCGWNFYRGLLCVISFILLWNLVRSVVQRDSLGLTLNCVQAGIMAVITHLKMILLGRNWEPLAVVRRYVNRRQFGRNVPGSSDIRSKGFYRIRRIIVFNVVLMLLMIVPTLKNVSSVPVLRMPFDVRDRMPAFQTGFETLITWVLLGYGIMIIADFVVMYMLLSGLTIELQITAQCFGGMFQRAADNIPVELESVSGNSDEQEATEKNCWWKLVQEEFGDCVHMHQSFLATLDTARPLLNALFLIVYYSTATNLACGAFFVLYSDSFTSYSFQILYYSVFVLFECYFLTRLVDTLTDVNEFIGEQVYDLDWPMKLEYDPKLASEYRKVKLTMLTVLAISQEPLRLNCFGLFEFTQERVTELTMMTYDVIGFFRNFI